HAHASGQIETAANRRRALSVYADAEVVQFGIRQREGEREIDKRRERERRQGVDRVLLVVLREEEHTGLPLQRSAVGETNRGVRCRRDSHFLRELEALLVVVAHDE